MGRSFEPSPNAAASGVPLNDCRIMAVREQEYLGTGTRVGESGVLVVDHVSIGLVGVDTGQRHDGLHSRAEFQEVEDGSMMALGEQVGGDHYKDMKIQPFEYALANEIPYVEGTIIKYVSRWRKKGGLEDLKKARHALDVLIEFESVRPYSSE